MPVQNCPWDKDGKGRVYLIKEKTKNKLLKKIIGWLGRSQDFHIHLDELGIGRLAAGRRPAHHPGDQRRSEANDSPPASNRPRARLAKFFAMLARDGFVRWRLTSPEKIFHS